MVCDCGSGDLLHFTLKSCTCSPLSTGMLWEALLSGGFAFLVGSMAGASRFLGTHFPSGMSLVKYNLFPKLCPIPHTPRALFTQTTPVSEFRSLSSSVTFVPRGNMIVLSSSISAKVSKMSRHEWKAYRWQWPTTQSPTQQHNEPQRKIFGLPSDGPPPPPGAPQGVGNDNGGGGTQGVPNPHYECPHKLGAVHGAPGDHHCSQSWCGGALTQTIGKQSLTTFICPHPTEEEQNEGGSHDPYR